MFGWMKRTKPYAVQPVTPGATIALGLRRLPTGENAIALIGALQAQFPQSRIHLFVGLGALKMAGQIDCGYRHDRRDDRGSKPVLTLSEKAAQVREANPESAEKAVVVTNYLTPDFVWLTSIPPE